MWVSQIVSIVKSDQCHKLTESQKSPGCHYCFDFHGLCFVIVFVLVTSTLVTRSIFRKVKSVLGNSKVPDGYLWLGHLLSCHWQAPNTYWHRSPCLCQNNKKKPFPKDHGSSVSKAKASILQQERYKKKIRHRIEKVIFVFYYSSEDMTKSTKFLAIQKSSIGDVVTHSVINWLVISASPEHCTAIKDTCDLSDNWSEGRGDICRNTNRGRYRNREKDVGSDLVI